MDNLAIFKERLAELIDNANLTAEKLIKIIGVSESAISNWKTQQNTISLDNALAIAEYFNCSLDFLFGRSENHIDFIAMPTLPFYNRLREIMKDENVSRYRICLDLKIYISSTVPLIILSTENKTVTATFRSPYF